MASSTDNRHDHDRGFNTIRNSAVEKRTKNEILQKYTVLTVLALFALTVVILLVMAIGGIIANVSGNDHTGPDDERVNWGTITVTTADAQQGDLVIVNDTHAYTFPSGEEHLQEIYAAWSQHSPRTYVLAGLSKYMDKDALTAMDAMLTDFAAASGKSNVQIRYAYRTYKEQEAFSVAPGHSDHHTGLGCELKYVIQTGKNIVAYELSTDETYAWLTDNCHKYGFVIRYPADKTEQTGVADYISYFRYVGIPHATYMKANGLCMEEYVTLLKSYTDKNPLAINGADGKYYEVYYVAVNDGSATVKYPTNYAYTISGTNEGGVVITVDRSKALNPTESGTTADTSAN